MKTNRFVCVFARGLLPTMLLACTSAQVAAPTSAAPADGQAIVDEELRAAAARADVRSALAVVLDARDGRVLAMQSVTGSALDPERPARERRSHGSVGKTFTFAIALDRGAITASDHFDGAPIAVAEQSIHDAETRDTMSVEDALAFSSNVAAVQVFERVGRRDLVAGLHALHLDAGVPASAVDDDAVAARVAYGPALDATPLEIASALAAVVNGGVYHAPWREGEAPTTGERALASETSATMRSLLEAAVARDDATGHLARLPDRRVGGKTGTMPLGDGATHGCFAGAVPIDDPEIVIVVDVIARTSDYSGGTLAAPTFVRIAERWVLGASDLH